MQLAVLVYIFRDEEVLLGIKKTGIGAGRVMAPGGKVELGEDPLAAIVREAEQEVGLRLIDPAPLGVLIGHNPGAGDHQVVIFTADQFTGDLRPSRELHPAWYPVQAPPVGLMMAGDRFWFDHVLNRQPFRAEVWYDADWHVVQAEVQPAIG